MHSLAPQLQHPQLQRATLKVPQNKEGKKEKETRNHKTKQRQQIEAATAAKNVSTAKTAINRFWPVPNPHHPTPPPNQLVPAACLFTFFIWLPQKKTKETKTKDSKGCSTCALKLQVQLATRISDLWAQSPVLWLCPLVQLPLPLLVALLGSLAKRNTRPPHAL